MSPGTCFRTHGGGDCWAQLPVARSPGPGCPHPGPCPALTSWVIWGWSLTCPTQVPDGSQGQRSVKDVPKGSWVAVSCALSQESLGVTVGCALSGLSLRVSRGCRDPLLQTAARVPALLGRPGLQHLCQQAQGSGVVVLLQSLEDQAEEGRLLWPPVSACDLRTPELWPEVRQSSP